MTAYYNENDSFAAAWLRNLIAEGVIAYGEVDERSIVEVQPEDLKGFTQGHLFAGVGVWSHALRSAGWSDDEPVWIGSCPCPPFSAAGKKGCPFCKDNHGRPTRVQFLGDGHSFGCPSCSYRDPRHLWPEMWRLVEKRRPATLFGEQVASADGRTWIDIVQSDVEAADYAFAPLNLCAAGFGAPHIRQRFFFVADNFSLSSGRLHGGWQNEKTSSDRARVGSVANTECNGRWPDESRRELEGREIATDGCTSSELGFAGKQGLEGHTGDGHGKNLPRRIEARKDGPTRPPGPANGYWRDAVWIPCKDGSYRPTQPEIFPLVDGPSRNRVGLLRGAGNAIVAPVAEAFIRAFMETKNG